MELVLVKISEIESLAKDISEIKNMVKEFGLKKSFDDRWLTNKQVTELLKISSRTLQKYRDEGEISFSQRNGKIYYRIEDVDQFLMNKYHKAFAK